jgi:hypothetical protein
MHELTLDSLDCTVEEHFGDAAGSDNVDTTRSWTSNRCRSAAGHAVKLDRPRRREAKRSLLAAAELSRV